MPGVNARRRSARNTGTNSGPTSGPAPTGHAYLDQAPYPVPFAHRGGAEHPEITGLENTLKAFKHAAGLGYDYLETDVHATRDGVLLAFHDDVLDRVTNRTGAISALTWAEVKEALIGTGERIPTLAQLFDELPEARFNIDIKGSGAIRPLLDFIRSRGVEDRVLVASWSHRDLQEFRRLAAASSANPPIATGASPLEIALFVAAPTGWLAKRLTGGRVAALQVPHRQGRIPVTTRFLLKKAKSAGVPVHVWTIDDADEMNSLLDLGVHGLMTDRTDILRQVLVQRGQWHESSPRNEGE